MKKYLKKIMIYIIIIAVMLTAYEFVRPRIVSMLPDNSITIENVIATEQPTEFDIFVKSEETQTQLHLLFDKYKIEQEEAELKTKQNDLELRKEELRKQELDLKS